MTWDSSVNCGEVVGQSKQQKAPDTNWLNGNKLK